MTGNALSDPFVPAFQEKCTKEHSSNCDHCDKIPELLKCIQGLLEKAKANGLNEDDVRQMNYTINLSHTKIFAYKHHMMRSFVQNFAWDQWFHSKDSTTVFVTEG